MPVHSRHALSLYIKQRRLAHAKPYRVKLDWPILLEGVMAREALALGKGIALTREAIDDQLYREMFSTKPILERLVAAIRNERAAGRPPSRSLCLLAARLALEMPILARLGHIGSG